MGSLLAGSYCATRTSISRSKRNWRVMGERPRAYDSTEEISMLAY
jgi:hypothetical protein